MTSFRTFVFTLLLTLTSLSASAQTPQNPFQRFFGTWTLKNNDWQQRWDGQNTEQVKIENHLTHCAPVNTPISVLCRVTSPGLSGHILWSFDPVAETVHHLSSFGDQRTGFGSGKVMSNGDLALTVQFPSEGRNTYRKYTYKWLSEDSYELYSEQFREGKATSNFYGGVFVKVSAGGDSP